MKALVFLPLAAVVFVAAQAHADAPVCPAPAVLPSQWTSFAQPTAVLAGATVATAAQLSVGQAYTAQMVPTAQMTYAVPLYKPAPDGSFGGLFTLTVTAAGVYEFGLDGKAWIDVTDGKQVSKSVAHGEGVACSPLHKTVDFQLAPGTYTVQLSTAARTPLTIEVITK